MQGFQNFKNEPRHWSIDADVSVDVRGGPPVDPGIKL